jgi:hypothetical protein
MASFSQRYGYKAVEGAFQRERVDEILRIALWNILSGFMWDKYDRDAYGYVSDENKQINRLFSRLWFRYLKRDMDELPAFRHEGYRHQDGYNTLKAYFLQCEWYEVYDCIEFLLRDEDTLLDKEAAKVLNQVLERENAAYRIVHKEVVEITDSNEIHAIEEALNHPEQPVRTHIRASLALMSDRKSPDYRNSIKEAISAVEAACRLVTRSKTATLGDALKKVPDLHPALQKAFSALYGFTSDAAGIRHSLLEESNLTYADAKFMLAACSAFVSYLKANATPKKISNKSK